VEHSTCGLTASNYELARTERANYQAEQQLRSPGIAWTIVRASPSVELWAEKLAKAVVFGRGTTRSTFSPRKTLRQLSWLLPIPSSVASFSKSQDPKTEHSTSWQP
jgi:hypothetical protein